MVWGVIFLAFILIVEDDAAINKILQKNLVLMGHKCRAVYDAEAALDEIEGRSFDLVLLDVMLPGMDGFAIAERIKDVPVIFLTAKNSLQDRIKGFKTGADDYITKPFEMLELQARVTAVLRRTNKICESFSVGDVNVLLDSRLVYVKDELVECTPREYDLLEALIINRNIALSREKLLELAWGYDYMGDTRTVDVHIQRLRKKLSLEDHIVTVYKMGYRLEAKV